MRLVLKFQKSSGMLVYLRGPIINYILEDLIRMAVHLVMLYCQRKQMV